MKKVKLRNQRVSDAQRFFDILNNKNFIYFQLCPKNVEAEREFLKKNVKKRKENLSYHYAILFEERLVGGCGININQHRKHIGEIGYFIDEEYWGKGIATKAVGLLEKICFKELGLKRIQLVINPNNKASEKVAIKCGYKKEGKMKKAIEMKGKFYDGLLYAKTR